MPHKNLLLIDSESNKISDLIPGLKDLGYSAIAISSAEKALTNFSNLKPDYIFCNYKISGTSSTAIADQIRKINPYIPVFTIVNHDIGMSTISKLNENKTIFLKKPFAPEDIKYLISNFENSLLQTTINSSIQQLQNKYEYYGLIGKSKSMVKVIQQIEVLSRNNGTVLIMGEQGSGKELVAKAIHLNSNRKKGPFIEVSCSAIPAELIDSELYGSMADFPIQESISGQNGYFKKAIGGTIFIDEIDTMTLEAQANLTHFLQNTKHYSHTSLVSTRDTFRIIATSNQPLENLVNQGKFRYDLFYRINILPISIPPLRERKEDIPLLIDHYLHQFNSYKDFRIQPKAMKLLMHHTWPGNIRQLESLMERFSLTIQGDIIYEHNLPGDFTAETKFYLDIDSKYSLEKTMRIVEKNIIVKALTLSKGNKKLASEKLKIPYSTLRHKIDKLVIDKTEYHSNPNLLTS